MGFPYRVSMVVSLVSILLGCAGLRLPIGPGWNNSEACRRYVDSYNALLCVTDHDRLSPVDNCTPELDRSACDLTEQYTCLREQLQCVDGKVDVSGQTACGDRSCN